MEYDYKASCLKRLELSEKVKVERSGHKPQSGDVVALKVAEDRGGFEIELPGGETVPLEEGDVVLSALGNRAGVKGYIGKVPERLEIGDPVHFIGGPDGAVFGEFLSSPKGAEPPLETELQGYVSRNGNILNVKEFGVERRDDLDSDIKVLAVTSTRMDAGKTTLAAKLIEELTSRGYNIGSVKLTGSAREHDRLRMKEAGATVSLDFVDAGLPTTVEDAEDVVGGAKGLIQEVWDQEVDMIVAELGAGVISKYNVQNVLRDLDLRKTVFSMASVALDVAGAYGLKKMFEDADYEIDFVSGPITDTTAGIEKVEETLGVPALNAFREDELEEAADLVEEELENRDS